MRRSGRNTASALAPGIDAESFGGLERAVPGGVSRRAIDRLAYAHDASHYLLTPRAVVMPTGRDQVAALMRAAQAAGCPLTFRSGGTSLSGQASSEHLLVDTRRHFRDVTVEQDGLRVTVGPGVTVAAVNSRLAPYGRKLGPDPASEKACTIGGVIANNSSGMVCGTRQNAYRTLESAVLVLPSGTVLDTSSPDCDRYFAHAEPDLYRGLLRLRDRVRSSPASVAKIKQLFGLKNTMGYGVNAFIDFATPTEILLRLVVGSEGTLAFVAAATFETVPLLPHRATGLLVFRDLHSAAEALPELVPTGLAAIELMDATSLRVAQQAPGAGTGLRGLSVQRHAALLVEYQESSAEDLAKRVADGAPTLDGLELAGPAAALTGSATARAALWHIRKGLYAAVAGNRPSGTTALLEDIAVPVENLADTTEELVRLFEAHHYRDSVIFGHAKDGNIHFMLNETFDAREATRRYLAFTDDLVDLVLSRNGTLKAEHGTGRMMVPFVRRQYGDELHAVMLELKRLCDPSGILNPDVILSSDDEVHVRHLKSTPTVEEEVDRCVECGFCEPVCPSRDLTTTPRQRIVVRREITRAESSGDRALAATLRAEYEYDGIQTCAADGMCQTACPVSIDTGQLITRLRAENDARLAAGLWHGAARHWNTVTRAGALGLSLARKAPRVSRGGIGILRRLAGAESVPAWSADLPAGGRPRPAASTTGQTTVRRDAGTSSPTDAEVVYFPACIGSIFGPAERTAGVRAGAGVSGAFLDLCRLAGIRVRMPEDMASLCCCTPWKSKGHARGHATMAEKTLPRLWQASDHGRLPVVVDASSCTEGLAELVRTSGDRRARINVLDSVTFAASRILPRLTIEHRLASVTVHPTCSSFRLGLDDDLRRLSEAIASEVVVPSDWGCCGFAGDRGLLHPELTAAATAAEAAQVASVTTSAYASVNRTCEIGMTRATGRTYRHILELLHDATRTPARDLLREPPSRQ